MYLFILVIIHSPMFMGLSLVVDQLEILGFRRQTVLVELTSQLERKRTRAMSTMCITLKF